MKRRTLLTTITIAIGAFFAQAAFAATPAVHVRGPIGVIRTGDVVAVDVLLDSAGREINAAEIHLTVDSRVLKVEKLAREQSLFTLWPEEPAWDNATGEITFTGGRPNGAVSADGSVGTIYFTTLLSGTTTLRSEGSTMYLNDGAGTAIALGTSELQLQVSDPLVEGIVLTSLTHPTSETWSKTHAVDVAWDAAPDALYSYVFSTDSQAVPDDTPETTVGNVRYEDLQDGVYYFTIKSKASNSIAWSNLVQRRFMIDATPPEPLALRTVSPASGVLLLVWQSFDTVSGVARSTLAVNGTNQGEGTSPLTLRPEWRGKKLTITVEDHAGNVTASQWLYATGTATRANIPSWLLWLASLVVLIALALLFLRKRV